MNKSNTLYNLFLFRFLLFTLHFTVFMLPSVLNQVSAVNESSQLTDTHLQTERLNEKLAEESRNEQKIKTAEKALKLAQNS